MSQQTKQTKMLSLGQLSALLETDAEMKQLAQLYQRAQVAYARVCTCLGIPPQGGRIDAETGVVTWEEEPSKGPPVPPVPDLPQLLEE